MSSKEVNMVEATGPVEGEVRKDMEVDRSEGSEETKTETPTKEVGPRFSLSRGDSIDRSIFYGRFLQRHVSTESAASAVSSASAASASTVSATSGRWTDYDDEEEMLLKLDDEEKSDGESKPMTEEELREESKKLLEDDDRAEPGTDAELAEQAERLAVSDGDGDVNDKSKANEEEGSSTDQVEESEDEDTVDDEGFSTYISPRTRRRHDRELKKAVRDAVNKTVRKKARQEAERALREVEASKADGTPSRKATAATSGASMAGKSSTSDVKGKTSAAVAKTPATAAATSATAASTSASAAKTSALGIETWASKASGSRRESMDFVVDDKEDVRSKPTFNMSKTVKMPDGMRFVDFASYRLYPGGFFGAAVWTDPMSQTVFEMEGLPPFDVVSGVIDGKLFLKDLRELSKYPETMARLDKMYDLSLVERATKVMIERASGGAKKALDVYVRLLEAEEDKTADKTKVARSKSELEESTRVRAEAKRKADAEAKVELERARAAKEEVEQAEKAARREAERKEARDKISPATMRREDLAAKLLQVTIATDKATSVKVSNVRAWEDECRRMDGWMADTPKDPPAEFAILAWVREPIREMDPSRCRSCGDLHGQAECGEVFVEEPEEMEDEPTGR